MAVTIDTCDRLGQSGGYHWRRWQQHRFTYSPAARKWTREVDRLPVHASLSYIAPEECNPVRSAHLTSLSDAPFPPFSKPLDATPRSDSNYLFDLQILTQLRSRLRVALSLLHHSRDKWAASYARTGRDGRKVNYRNGLVGTARCKHGCKLTPVPLVVPLVRLQPFHEARSRKDSPSAPLTSSKACDLFLCTATRDRRDADA